jgi:FkbM family methyltransferase
VPCRGGWWSAADDERVRSPTLSAAQRAYAVGLRARYGRTGMPWRIHDVSVRIDPRMRHLVPHDSEATLFRFIQQQVMPGEIVLDIGSFLGIYAVLEARRAGPGGRVVAMEPTAWSASFARRHITFNGDGAAPITLIEAAAGDSPGRATFYEYDEPYVNSLAAAVDVSAGATNRSVEVTTIDQVCDRCEIVPSLVRMDVQGAEFHALRGARNTIRRAGARLRIVAEMHPQCWPSFGVDEASARHTIASLGLVAEPLESGTPLFTRDSHIVLRPGA